jgi:Family of unknown function (DUF6526)
MERRHPCLPNCDNDQQRINMDPQTFTNHTRWHPPFHFFIMPVLLVNFIWSIVDLAMNPGVSNARSMVVALALLMLGFFTRINALRAQDRVIRLEETLRLQRLLAPELSAQLGALQRGQVIALRFAADDELQPLVVRVLAGELSKPVDIKRAIKTWRPDTHRL